MKVEILTTDKLNLLSTSWETAIIKITEADNKLTPNCLFCGSLYTN